VARRLRVGLTGGIGSGKTTVALRFKELGVPVIDADEIAHALVAPGQQALAELVATFGMGILMADGQLDRRRLRNQVFANPELRKELEAILHPRVRAELERGSAAAPGPYVLQAIPLLVESGNRASVDRILVVDVEEELQLQRVMARDASTRDEARAILAAQASRAARLNAADDVLTNHGSIADLRHEVDLLHRQYLRLTGAENPEKPR
jgi:dephospho-CoA kinase